MNLSETFLNLVKQQLCSFEFESALKHLVVYVAQSNEGNPPTLEVLGQWPELEKVFQPLEADRELRAPSSDRRWYPLQEGSILLGVLRVERFSSKEEWPENLDIRLKACATVLGHCLALELEREKLLNNLSHQRDQISVMIHQLRNPLAALRTYAQLLLRKLGPDNIHISLVEGLLNEQEQLNNYVSLLDDLSQVKLPSSEIGSTRLLLPPVLSKEASLSLKILLDPLIERAAAKANLEGRNWLYPSNVPSWVSEPCSLNDGVVAEIIANLLENAFRYSLGPVDIGISFNDHAICVWDSGVPIDKIEREKIFEKGFRGDKSNESKGRGLGLAFGRQLAEDLGGELKLLERPYDFDSTLPLAGNAFVLFLPKESSKTEKE